MKFKKLINSYVAESVSGKIYTITTDGNAYKIICLNLNRVSVDSSHYIFDDLNTAQDYCCKLEVLP